MCTSGHGGQAIGVAAALCLAKNKKPADYIDPVEVKELQRALIATGQHIPQLKLNDYSGQFATAKKAVSSELKLTSIKPNGSYFRLDYPMAMLLPLDGKVPGMTLSVKGSEATVLDVQIRTSLKSFNFTPDVVMFQKSYTVNQGEQNISIEFDEIEVEKGYYFICFMKNSAVEVAESDELITGVMPVYNYQNPAVSNYGSQRPTEDIGVESFEFWCPKRRPIGKNLALNFSPALSAFSSDNLHNEVFRPVVGANAWVADKSDAKPTLSLSWDEVTTIKKVRLFFDTDADHAMENVQMGHYDSAMPFCVKSFEIVDDKGAVVYQTSDNHQTVKDVIFETPLQVTSLSIRLDHPSDLVPAALFGLIVK
jgi:hypothetical protein